MELTSSRAGLPQGEDRKTDRIKITNIIGRNTFLTLGPCPWSFFLRKDVPMMAKAIVSPTQAPLDLVRNRWASIRKLVRANIILLQPDLFISNMARDSGMTVIRYPAAKLTLPRVETGKALVFQSGKSIPRV